MNGQVAGVVVLIVAVLLFLVIRRFWLWYFNLSAILQVQREQLAATRELHEAQVATNLLLRALLSQPAPADIQAPIIAPPEVTGRAE